MTGKPRGLCHIIGRSVYLNIDCLVWGTPLFIEFHIIIPILN